MLLNENWVQKFQDWEFQIGDFFFQNQLQLLRFLCGATLHQEKVLNVQTSYFTIGNPQGEPVLFIPGFSDIKESYLFLCRMMPSDYYCIAVDLPGFGSSEVSLQNFSMEFYIHWLTAFIESLKLPGVHIYGNSLGGAIIGEYAYLYPHKILSLIFSCSAGIYVDSEECFYSEYKEGRNLFLVETMQDMERFFERLFYRKPYIPYPILRYMYLHYKKNKEHYANIMDGLTRKFILEEEYKKIPTRYKKLNHKTLVIWGEEDTLFPLYLGKITASHIPGAEFKTIPNCGHLPHLERPLALQRELVEFLKKTKSTLYTSKV